MMMTTTTIGTAMTTTGTTIPTIIGMLISGAGCVVVLCVVSEGVVRVSTKTLTGSATKIKSLNFGSELHM